MNIYHAANLNQFNILYYFRIFRYLNIQLDYLKSHKIIFLIDLLLDFTFLKTFEY